MRSYKGLVAALEEEQMIEAAIADARPVAPTIPNATESPETAMLEVQEDIFNGDNQTEQVADAIDVSNVLSEYQEVLDTVKDSGGLSTESLQILNIGLNYCYRRAGLENHTVSMEGYSSRKEVTQVALESIGEKINTLFKAIVDAIKNGIAWMVDFIKKLFSSTRRLQARITNLKKQATKVGITDTKQELTNVSTISSKISMAGKVDLSYATDVTEKFVTKAMFPMYSDVTKIVTSLSKSFTDSEEGKKYGSTLDAVVLNMKSISKLSLNGNLLPGEIDFKIDSEGIIKPLDEANKIFLTISHLDNLDPFKSKLTKVTRLVNESVAAAKNSLKFESIGSKSEIDTLPVLSVNEINASLGNVEKILTEVLRFETEGKKMEKECNYLIKKASFIHNLSKLNDFDVQQEIRAQILKLSSSFLFLGNFIYNRSMKMCLNVSKAAADYCELSLNKPSDEKMSSSTSVATA